MNLNYTAFLLIAFIPLMIAYIWYHPKLGMTNWAGEPNLPKLRPLQILWAFILSITIVYGYINLVIHQMGFYELFFTDIMKGSTEAQQIVDEFLAKYGDKHRSFGHGVFHGAINAVVFALPFIGFHALLGQKSSKFIWLHFLYWLITSMIIGGLIAAFV